jgi:hypothetical protein
VTIDGKMSIEDKIISIADAVQMLTCMIGSPNGPEEMKIWWKDKLEMIHRNMGDIINDR